MADYPSVVNIRVSKLREGVNGKRYNSLQEWLDDSDHHMYIGRDVSHRVPGAKKSKWCNPYSTKKYKLGDSLELYLEHLHKSGLVNDISELKGKVLGCWCVPDSQCHGEILVNVYKEHEKESQMTSLKVKTFTKKGQYQRYTFPEGETWKDLISNLKIRTDTKLVRKVIKILQKCPYYSYYFESPEISDLLKPLEFVLFKSSSLHFCETDWTPFKKYISQTSTYSTAFDNLSGDTRLVIPTRRDGDYGHLANFIREAGEDEILDLLSVVASEVMKASSTSDRKVYLSTAGDHIPWLHFRISKKPKYYNYDKYK